VQTARPAVPELSYGERAQREAQRVAQIRQLLRAGNGQTALQALSALEREVSLSLLRQERDALRIDALIMLGRIAEASGLAQRFRKHYPKSPLLARWANSAAQGE